MIYPPKYESPGGPVPQPAEEHRYCKIPVSHQPAEPVSAQTFIDIIPEPGGEAYVPPLPELARVRRKIRQVEIHHYFKTHAPAQPYGDIRISRKITEYLKGEGV